MFRVSRPIRIRFQGPAVCISWLIHDLEKSYQDSQEPHNSNALTLILQKISKAFRVRRPIRICFQGPAVGLSWLIHDLGKSHQDSQEPTDSNCALCFTLTLPKQPRAPLTQPSSSHAEGDNPEAVALQFSRPESESVPGG